MPLMNHFNNQFVHFHFTFIIHFFTLLSLHHFPLSHWHSLCLDFIPKLPSHEHSKKKITNTLTPVVLLSSKMAEKLTTSGWTMMRKYLTIAWNLWIPQVSASFFLRGPVLVTFLLYKPHRPHQHCCLFDLYLCTLPDFFNWSFRPMIYSYSYHSRQFF